MSDSPILDGSCNVLLVEDDEEFREILMRRLTRRGLSVVGVGHVVDALAAAAAQPFQVAIVDRTLPGGDGLHLMGRLKDLHPSLQVIVLSGHADQGSLHEARQQGAIEYLIKPCALADIEAAVRRAVEIGRGGDGPAAN